MGELRVVGSEPGMQYAVRAQREANRRDFVARPQHRKRSGELDRPVFTQLLQQGERPGKGKDIRKAGPEKLVRFPLQQQAIGLLIVAVELELYRTDFAGQLARLL